MFYWKRAMHKTMEAQPISQRYSQPIKWRENGIQAKFLKTALQDSYVLFFLIRLVYSLRPMHPTEREKQYFLTVHFGRILRFVWPTFLSSVLQKTYLLKQATANRNRQITRNVTCVLPRCALRDYFKVQIDHCLSHHNVVSIDEGRQSSSVDNAIGISPNSSSEGYWFKPRLGQEEGRKQYCYTWLSQLRIHGLQLNHSVSLLLL